MAAEKPPYKLTIKMDAARPGALAKALAYLHELTAAHSLPGALRASVGLEGWDEATLAMVRATFEGWLRRNASGVDGRAVLDGPLVRPEEPEATPLPMDALFLEAHES